MAFFRHAMEFFFFLGFLGAVSGPMIAYVWFRHKRAERELELKHMLAERGMSADEICAVVRAGRPASIREEMAEAWRS